jgi:BR serine/threonine kinase
LKLENILIGKNNVIKIADFGFAKFLKNDVAATSCGSIHFAAPEVVKGIKYDGKKADMWSCGVILYVLLTGKLPFGEGSIRAIMQRVKTGSFLMPNVSDIMQDLISHLITVSPEQRFSVKDVKNHPAFRLSLPPLYVLPNPFLVIPKGPIELKENEFNFPNQLVQMGYDSVDEVLKELNDEGATHAKMFYCMINMEKSLSTLPWDEETVADSLTIPGSPFNAEIANNFACSDPNSLTDTSLWLNFDSLNYEQPAESIKIEIEGKYELIMFHIQQIVSHMGYTFLHPNEFQLICRRAEPRSFYCFNLLPNNNSFLLAIDRFGGMPQELRDIEKMLK